MQCVSNMLKFYTTEEFKMQNSSPETDSNGSYVLYNDSGYFTSQIPDPQSFSSNSNSDPSFEDISLPSKTECLPTNLNPVLSPELFSEDEESSFLTETSLTIENVSQTQRRVSIDEHFLKNDRILLKRVQENLSGVPPPPSVTILQLSVSDMLEKIKSNEDLFLSAKIDDTSKCVEKCNLSNSSCADKTVKSLLISSSKEEVEESKWPEIMNCRYHGLYFNRSSVSEEIEQSCSRYLSRYVGCETASSCTWSFSGTAPGSATKRRARMRWVPKSPGRRLSHLARRRITFSSANLQQSGANLSVIGNSSGVNRQLMIDPRRNVSLRRQRSPRKSPRKRSPRKSPRKPIRTPNSAKKRAVRQLNMDENPKMSTTKRALFQSPENSCSTTSSSETTSTSTFMQKAKRSLFSSPTKRSPVKTDRKRKRMDEESHPSKFPRSLSFDVHHTNALNAASSVSTTLPRRNSEIIVRNNGKTELSNLHKQKMLWAVSEALRAHQITMSHPQFRSFASVLCKVIKNQVPDLMSNGPRQPGSTSDRMLRIARTHSYAVTRGKTYDEIIEQIKQSNETLRSLKPPTGYVAPARNILQDKVMNIKLTDSKSPSAHSTFR